MKFSVFTVMMPDCTLEETVRLLQKYGYDGVEWRFTTLDPNRQNETPSFWVNNLSTVPADSSIEQLKSIAELTKAHGLVIPNLAAYISTGDILATEQAMKAAAVLGAPSIRIAVPGYNKDTRYWEALQSGREYLAEVEKLSKRYSVKGTIETHHGNIASSASAARRLVDGFDPDHIGVIYDPGNMVHEGFEAYRMGLEILGAYLAHVHVKNAASFYDVDSSQWRVAWRTIDDGEVYWPQVIEALQAIGYDGWLSMEDFSMSAPTEETLEKHISYLKQFIT
ncbi:sugar phosphate isomerase/epimerase family protein [Paenibacillus septentrionalis]|uniref:Sugar phosphate isomerase/epimerase family protein n=1 Tax=Paenibacillus septentrionalis TaxID=429342 RepID=A0ABW1V000_9BACL